MSFSEKDEAKLIKIVATNTVLYDKSHINYRNTVAKDYVWKTIGEMLKKNSDDCKRKWKAIRDGYKRFKKTHQLGSGLAAPKHSKDKRHRQLSFLDNFDQKCECSNLPLSPVQENIEEIDDMDSQLSGKEQEGYKEGATSYTEQNRDNDESIISENAVKDNQPNKVKNKKENLISKHRKRMDDKRRLLKSILKKKDDDVELFIRHMGEVLRKLPAVERAQAKKHLHAVLSDYEISAAKQSSERQSSPYLLNSNSSSDVRNSLSSTLSSSEDSLGPMDTDLPGSSSASQAPPPNHTYQLPQSIHHSSIKIKEELYDPLQSLSPTILSTQANQGLKTEINDSP